VCLRVFVRVSKTQGILGCVAFRMFVRCFPKTPGIAPWVMDARRGGAIG
jgi:hypothetical protein